MAVATFLQSKTYSSNTASNVHALTLTSPVRKRGGAIGPSTLIMTVSYDGASGNQVSSITDTGGNTWQRGTSASNSSNTNGEMWYAFNASGGIETTITVNLSSSVKMTMCCVEMDQIRPVAPLDITAAQIYAVSSTARITNTPAKRSGQLEVIVAGIAWQSATLNCNSGGTGFTGLVTLKDGSSNIGVGMVRRTAEVKNVSAPSSIGRFTMSTTSTVPCAVMSLSFYRDGVVTADAEDGYLQNFEGVVFIDNSSTEAWVYKSSTSAPLGGTGGSEIDQAYAFFPDYSANLLPGVTIGSAITLYYNTSVGFDDGTGYMSFMLNVFKNNELGSTIDASDESFSTSGAFDLGVTPTITGEHSVALTKSTHYNTAGVTAAVMYCAGDTLGLVSSTNALISTRDGNIPMYLQLALDYPVDLPTKAMMGVGT